MKLKNSFCIMRRRANSSLHAFDTCLENKLKRLLQERERERAKLTKTNRVVMAMAKRSGSKRDFKMTNNILGVPP